jgi:hypothetical protein
VRFQNEGAAEVEGGCTRRYLYIGGHSGHSGTGPILVFFLNSGLRTIDSATAIDDVAGNNGQRCIRQQGTP